MTVKGKFMKLYDSLLSIQDTLSKIGPMIVALERLKMMYNNLQQIKVILRGIPPSGSHSELNILINNCLWMIEDLLKDTYGTTKDTKEIEKR